jgi:molecular chaperone GrpE
MPEQPERQQGGHHPPAAEGGQQSAHRHPSDPSLGASQDVDQSRAPSEASTRAEIDSAAQEVERDLEALEQTKRERDEYLELARRTKADFENYRKRVAGESESAKRRGTAGLAAELVPVLDNLERALIAAGIDPAAALAGEVSVDGALEQGVVLTYRDLRKTMERAGVEVYEPTGEKFDPEWQEAISTRPVEGTDPGVVLDVVEKGYRLDGQVIRAARVVVSE